MKIHFAWGGGFVFGNKLRFQKYAHGLRISSAKHTQ